MNVLLLNPYNRSYVVMPSLGLGYLATVLRAQGHQLSVLNCIKDKMDANDVQRFIKEHKIRLVGFQLFSYDMNSIKSYLEPIKSGNSSVVTVAGGAHPSGDPQGTLRMLPQLDFVFQGEAEIGLPLLVTAISSEAVSGSGYENIAGLVWRRGKDIICNPRAFIHDLDSLDFPSWDLLAPDTYPEASHGAFAKNFPTAPVITTRGCPYQCTFCSAKTIAGQKIRRRSVANVIAEIEYLVANFGIKEIHIEDDNFTLDKNYVYQFCDQIRKIADGQLSWSCPAGIRIDSLDGKLIAAMEEAGCYSVALGIEFGTPKMLEATKKKITIKMIREKLALFKDSKIKTTGFFMMGYPGETEQDIEATIKLSRELPLRRAQYNNFMPLPGSEIYQALQAAGGLGDLNWDDFFVHRVSFDSGISKDKLKSLQRQAYLRFYLRPKIIKDLLFEIKSLRHIVYLGNRFIDALRGG